MSNVYLYDIIMITVAKPVFDRMSERNRTLLAKGMMGAFDVLELSPRERCLVLGLDEDNRTSLARYAAGKPLAANRDQLDRAGHLAGIYKSLAILFAHNPEAIPSWMHSHNRAFEGRTPLEVIRDDGLVGLIFVRAYLDHARGP